MNILALETSCDETGIALLAGAQEGMALTFTTRKAALLSQAALHAPYGGVYPNLAKREHEKNLPTLFAEFKDAVAEVDAIAVTHGPGLEPALWQGVEFAKKLAEEYGKPLLPVNHMEGHLVSSLARRDASAPEETYRLEQVELPVLALLISGGHTELVLMREWFAYEVVGKTLDDAVGECFDKVARMLGLSYPGGPEISKLADQHRTGKLSGAESFSVALPRPMLNSGTCDFSFSGLKTAVLYTLRTLTKERPLAAAEQAAFAAEFENAIGEVLVAKVRRALHDTGARTFVLGGGVAANRYIREQLQALVLEEFPEVELRTPELSLTGDNAVMIGHAALARLLMGRAEPRPPEEVRAVGNLSIAG